MSNLDLNRDAAWLSREELDAAREKLPILYVDAVPLRVDDRGAVVAVGVLLRLGPDGEPRESLALPVQCPTMPCFGGDDLRTLFVTTARKGRPAAELGRLPASGSVIHMRVESAGLPVAFFED